MMEAMRWLGLLVGVQVAWLVALQALSAFLYRFGVDGREPPECIHASLRRPAR